MLCAAALSLCPWTLLTVTCDKALSLAKHRQEGRRSFYRNGLDWLLTYLLYMYSVGRLLWLSAVVTGQY